MTGLIIRPAEARDIPAMVRMAGDFITASNTGVAFNPDYLDGSFRAMIADGSRLALVLDVGEARGMLCAGVTRSLWEPVGQAVEHIFWIDPEARGQHAQAMLQAYTAWAHGMGCKQAGMVALPGRSLDRLYARAGFALTETTYSKVL